MKSIKKIMALVLSLAMIFTMSVTVFAENEAETTGDYTITAPAGNHTYEIYQIFTGDLSDDILSNVKWGQNGTGTEGEAVSEDILNALNNVVTKTDAEKLAVITQYADLDGTPTATIGKDNESSCKVPAGYYLIKDKEDTLAGTEESYTTYIVTLSKNTTIEPKSAVPSFEKKIKDTNDSKGEISGWQDSADYDIGDQVPFKLEGTVASNYDAYKTYYMAFHDVEEKGLTFNSESVKVYVDGTEITSEYEVKTSELTDGCTFEVVFSDLKQIESVKANSKITVEYTSTLNENANLGNQGNVNKAKMEFSNNPNQEQGGEKETGETPWDNVIVFTYKVVVNKVDGEEKALAGAEFTLEKVLKNGEKQTITVVKSEDGTSFEFKGLDDGDYILTETKTPAGYNTIAPIKFTVTAKHNITWESEGRTDILTSLNGNVTTGNITFTSSDDKSTLTTKVINKKGITLPSTGGMGTTIFYVIGSILMIGAAITLVVKRRMSVRG